MSRPPGPMVMVPVDVTSRPPPLPPSPPLAMADCPGLVADDVHRSSVGAVGQPDEGVVVRDVRHPVLLVLAAVAAGHARARGGTVIAAVVQVRSPGKAAGPRPEDGILHHGGAAAAACDVLPVEPWLAGGRGGRLCSFRHPELPAEEARVDGDRRQPGSRLGAAARARGEGRRGEGGGVAEKEVAGGEHGAPHVQRAVDLDAQVGAEARCGYLRHRHC